MLQKIVIDGYNVLHEIEAYKCKLEVELKAARQQLIHDLKVYSASKKVDIVVVFDGSSEIHSPYQHMTQGNVKIIFSRAPQKADPVIIKIIKKDKQKHRLTVVTNDKEIKQYAKLAGCQLLTPQKLFQRICTPSKEEHIQNKFDNVMTAEELEEWKKIFGISD